MHLATLAQSRDCIWYLKELGADVNIRVNKLEDHYSTVRLKSVMIL